MARAASAGPRASSCGSTARKVAWLTVPLLSQMVSWMAWMAATAARCRCLFTRGARLSTCTNLGAGAAVLGGWGVSVTGALMADECEALNPAWTFAQENARPFVTWKVAATLDGRVAAADGTSRWITGEAARAEVHLLRADVDAILVGTGTVLADDPSLSARDSEGRLASYQPLRVVMGVREVPEAALVRDGSAPFLQIMATDPVEVLAMLVERDVHHVLLEGGPRLAAAFLRAGMIDAIRWYVAPALLGGGAPAVSDLGIGTISYVRRFVTSAVSLVGDDVRIDLSPTRQH